MVSLLEAEELRQILQSDGSDQDWKQDQTSVQIVKAQKENEVDGECKMYAKVWPKVK